MQLFLSFQENCLTARLSNDVKLKLVPRIKFGILDILQTFLSDIDISLLLLISVIMNNEINHR